jgi:hypothetical protein
MRLRKPVVSIVLTLLLTAPAVAEDTPATRPAGQLGKEIRAACDKAIGALSPQQKGLADHGYDSPAIRMISLFPGVRVGVRLGDLNTDQRAGIMTLLGTVLSSEGMKRAKQVFEQGDGAAEYFFVRFSDGGRGDPLVWRLEGHHFSLTTFVNEKDEVRLGTALIGGRPADVWDDLRDKARAIHRSLGEREQNDARAGAQPRRTASQPFSDPVQSGGIAMPKLTPQQRKHVKALLDGYRALFHPAALAEAARSFKKHGGHKELSLVYAGDPVAADGEFYCGVTGAGLHCEFDNRQGHVHMLLHFATGTLHEWTATPASEAPKAGG